MKISNTSSINNTHSFQDSNSFPRCAAVPKVEIPAQAYFSGNAIFFGANLPFHTDRKNLAAHGLLHACQQQSGKLLAFSVLSK